MKKPREFWIEFGGDPSNDREVYKRYSATEPFKPASFSDEVVHCIEFEAYERLAQELAELRAAYEERAVAMRHTGEMVRSLYAPKNERLNRENGLLRATLKRVADALDKVLPAATWFHLGPYGASPEIEDYHNACRKLKLARKVLTKVTANGN